MTVKFIFFNIITLAFLPLLFFPCISSAQGKSSPETAGDIIQILIPSTAYATTFALDDKEGRTQFYKSFFTNLGVTYALKITVNEQRPKNNGGYSFPSGHTSASFQGATFIQRRYGWQYGAPAYFAASYVGWSRIEGESDKHDLDDVVAGAAIGIISSLLFTEPYKGFVVTPTIDSGAYGLTISNRW